MVDQGIVLKKITYSVYHHIPLKQVVHDQSVVESDVCDNIHLDSSCQNWRFGMWYFCEPPTAQSRCHGWRPWSALKPEDRRRWRFCARGTNTAVARGRAGHVNNRILFFQVLLRNYTRIGRATKRGMLNGNGNAFVLVGWQAVWVHCRATSLVRKRGYPNMLALSSDCSELDFHCRVAMHVVAYCK